MAHGILFDLDETLIDRAISIFRYALRLHSDFIEDIRVPRDAFVSEFTRLDGNGYVPRDAFFEGLAQWISTPRIGPDAIAAHYAEDAWQTPTLMRGAQEGLRCIRSAGLPVGIVTNGGSKNQRQKIVNTGLDQLVDHLVISEEFGVKKPDPAIFLSACEALQIEPAQSRFVGDNPLLDITGAAAIGLRTIWLRRTVSWPKDHPRCFTIAVSSLPEAFDAVLRDA